MFASHPSYSRKHTHGCKQSILLTLPSVTTVLWCGCACKKCKVPVNIFFKQAWTKYVEKELCFIDFEMPLFWQLVIQHHFSKATCPRHGCVESWSWILLRRISFGDWIIGFFLSEMAKKIFSITTFDRDYVEIQFIYQ